jgi:hypothetical protein
MCGIGKSFWPWTWATIPDIDRYIPGAVLPHVQAVRLTILPDARSTCAVMEAGYG